jgi:excisionase family DNA binding protein
MQYPKECAGPSPPKPMPITRTVPNEPKGRNHGYAGETLPVADRLLTVGQVAENWQVSQRTVRRMIADGRLPIVRLGRAVRIPAKVAVR